jgi:glyoxylase-like metal-dependent hydrolase (beta-lactamase superfamily II)
VSPANVLRRRGARVLLALSSLLAVTLVVFLVRARPIAAAPPHARAEGNVAALPPIEVCWAELARNEAWGQVATAGVTRTSTWSITVSSLVVRHPRGVVAIDVGNSSHFAEEIAEYRGYDHFFLQQLPGSNRTVQTAPEALRAIGVDPERLFGVVLSHAHVDHAGGVVDLPGVPIFVAAEERAFIERTLVNRFVDVVPAQAHAMQGRLHELVFEPKAYETFDESADVFGDGSVVVVKLFGHTPGSVGTFVNLSQSLRVFHVGDAVNVVEAVERRVTKSVVMRQTDDDHERADAAVAAIARLHEAAPDIAILPAHDRPAWQRVFGAQPRCIAR